MAKKKNYDTLSDQPAALAARQREHRLRLRVQPQEPPDQLADPWLICARGLDALDDAARVFHPSVRGLVKEHLDAAAEALRELAWGPSEDSSRAEPLAFPSSRSGRGQKGMHARWHVNGGKVCTC